MALAFTKQRQWRQALVERFARSRRSGRQPVVISLHQGELVLARRRDGQLQFLHQACDSAADWPAQLTELINNQQLKGKPVSLVLPTGTYQMQAAERPANIPDDELAGAIIWSQTELLEDNPADLIGDVFDMPGTMNDQRVNLVVSRRDRLASLVRAMLLGQAEPGVISIQELALRSLLGETEQGTMLLLKLPQQEMQLLIVRQGQLYINRQLRGMERLGQQSEQDLAAGALDMLSLEIQRSMDYFMSQLRQGPVSQILLATDTDNQDTIATLLHDFFSMPVDSLLETCRQQHALASLNANELVALGALLELEAQGS